MGKRLLSFYIHDALTAIYKIQSFTKGVDLAAFEENAMVSDAVIRNFEVMGESLKRIPDPIREKFPEIPWKSIVGLRNTVLHEYLGVDLSIIFNLAHNLSETQENLEKCFHYLDGLEKA